MVLLCLAVGVFWMLQPSGLAPAWTRSHFRLLMPLWVLFVLFCLRTSVFAILSLIELVQEPVGFGRFDRFFLLLLLALFAIAHCLESMLPVLRKLQSAL